MQFITEDEYKERYKKKLWLWGSYTREKEAAERRLHEIEDEPVSYTHLKRITSCQFKFSEW